MSQKQLPMIIDEPMGTEITRLVITDIDSQRNGVAGEGFYVVKFTYYVGELHGDVVWGQREELLGVLFPSDSSRTAIIDPLNLASHWRGDRFADALRKAVSTHLGYDAWQ